MIRQKFNSTSNDIVRYRCGAHLLIHTIKYDIAVDKRLLFFEIGDGQIVEKLNRLPSSVTGQ